MDLIELLRDSCLVDDPELVEDTNYLALTDEQLQEVLLLANSRVSKGKYTLDSIPESHIYPVMLLSKKEIYHRLASKYAPDYTIQGNAGTLNISDRFRHFMELAKQMEEEYKNYLEDMELNRDVSNTDSYSDLARGEVFISSRYLSARNYRYSVEPKIGVKIDCVYTDKVELSWKIKSINRFNSYKIYFSEGEPIIDVYDNNKISPKARLIKHELNIHNNRTRITGLKPNTTYYVAIIVIEQNGLIGFEEAIFTTKGDELDEIRFFN